MRAMPSLHPTSTQQDHVNITQPSLSMAMNAFQYPNANGTTTWALPRGGDILMLTLIIPPYELHIVVPATKA